MFYVYHIPNFLFRCEAYFFWDLMEVIQDIPIYYHPSSHKNTTSQTPTVNIYFKEKSFISSNDINDFDLSL